MMVLALKHGDDTLKPSSWQELESMKNHGYRSLIGDPEQLAAERALAELRSGRAVLLRGSGESLVVTAFENLDADGLALMGRIGGAPRLVLSAARLRWLKASMTDAGVIPVEGLDLETLADLVASENDVLRKSAQPSGDAEKAALELVRLSLLLPAAVVFDAHAMDAALLGALVCVDASAVMGFRKAASSGLKIISRAPVPLEGVETCEFVVFRGGGGLREQIAVIIGKPLDKKPVPLRIHSACLTGDLFGSLKCDCGDQLRGTVRRMAAEGGGIILYLDQEGRGNGIANKIRAYCLQHRGYDTYDADELLGFENDHRNFDIAASMLRQLGVHEVQLMTNNPHKIKALEDAGLHVAATQRVITRTNGHNVGYLAAKRDRAGHLFDKDHVMEFKAANEG
jgi:GTP cyclohydrolase II